MVLMTLFYLLSLSFAAKSSQAEAIFTEIYDHNKWNSTESVSGPGSTLQETTALRQKLPILLESLAIKKLLDAPCGDFNWFQHIYAPSVELYIGIDVVEALIKKNNSQYAGDHTAFFHKNIITDVLPQVDMILCRDCLVHFPFKEIVATLQNFKKSGARYLLTTTFPDWQANTDINALGGWRPLNLELPPFNLPKPLIVLSEELPVNQYSNPKFASKSLALWELKDIELMNE